MMMMMMTMTMIMFIFLFARPVSATDPSPTTTTTAGTPSCWGSNFYGELGNGSLNNSNVPVLVASNDQNYMQISSGAEHTCAIAEDSKAFCWGDNYNGQLGDGGKLNSLVPVPVVGDKLWLKISSGAHHTCAIELGDQSLWCWGYNVLGNLGDGSHLPSRSPVRVSSIQSWIEVSADNFHTCGITSDQHAYCWGYNLSGELGDGTNSNANVPNPVAGNSTWLQISSGRDHSCGLQTDFSAWCWGSNAKGALGDGTYNSSNVPVRVAGNHSWTQVRAGKWYSCAIEASNLSVWCWGVNFYGGLGEDLSVTTTVPVRMAGDQSFIELTVSTQGRKQDAYACGIQQSDRAAYCWGDNYFGELGDGTNDFSNVSVRVSSDDRPWSQISVGNFHTCGIQLNSSIEDGLSPGGSLQNTTYPSQGDVSTSESSSTSIISSSNSSSTNTAAIVGGVVGGVVAVGIIIIAAAFMLVRKRKQKRIKAQATLKHPYAKAHPSHSSSSQAYDDIESGDATAASGQLPPTLPPDNLSSESDGKLKCEGNINVNGGCIPDDIILRRMAGEFDHDVTRPRNGNRSSGIPAHAADVEFTWPQVKLIRLLGTGSFGKVFLAEVNHTQVALKVLVDAKALTAGSRPSGPQEMSTSMVTGSSALSQASQVSLVKEVSIMAALRHPNVVQLVGWCSLPPSIALEFCPRGSLYSVLKRAATDQGGPTAAALTWQRRWRMAADAAAGMLHLHTRPPPVLHRDLKSGNLLVAADWTVKISDMGLSKLAEEATGAAATAGMVTNPRWLAPEVLLGQRPSKASDVFSFGVVLWELLTWQLPWAESSVHLVAIKVSEGQRLPIPPPQGLPGPKPDDPAKLNAYIGLMERCWAQNPTDRPDFERIANELETFLQ